MDWGFVICLLAGAPVAWWYITIITASNTKLERPPPYMKPNEETIAKFADGSLEEEVI